MTLDYILRELGTEIDQMTVTLLWNAEEDLDLTFNCDDGTTIDWNH